MKYVKVLVTINILILIISFFGILHISEKASLPFDIHSENNKLYVVSPFAINNSLILQIDNRRFTSREEIEVYINGKNINQSVLCKLKKNGSIFNYLASLKNFYSSFYIFSVSFASFLFICIGLLIIINSKDYPAANLCNLSLLFVGSIIANTWGNYNYFNNIIDYIISALFHFAYVFSPVFFLHFTFVFPQISTFNYKKIVFPLYLCASLLFILLYNNFLIVKNYQLGISAFVGSFNIARAMMTFVVTLSIINFIVAYKRTNDNVVRKKLRWLIYSISISAASFILLWVLPQAFTTYGFIPEEVVLLLISIIPFTFAAAIFKYHVLNVDLLINRSIVYTIVLGIVIVIYSLFITFLSITLSTEDNLTSLLSTIIIAVVFNPLKDKIQKFVDAKFYKVEYDYGKAQKYISHELNNTYNIQELATKIVKEIQKILIVNKCSLYFYDKQSDRFNKTYSHDKDAPNSIKVNRSKYIFKLNTFFTYPDNVEPGITYESLKSNYFKKLGYFLIFPMVSSSNEIMGFMAMGQKKSKMKYVKKDIDLIDEILLESAIRLEKFYLTQALVKKDLQEVQLKEINELKSFFISSISHDLKTPITSIKLFNELIIIDNKLSQEVKEQYSKIIEVECDRLTRMIDNVLDLNKIEKGLKTYSFKKQNLVDVVNYSLNLLVYYFEVEKCKVVFNKPVYSMPVLIDYDSMLNSVLNLLSNSLKYATIPKKIKITLDIEEGNAVLKIMSNSAFIPPEEIEKLGSPFYRSSGNSNRIPGSGIGIYLVKTIVNAHNGSLIMESNIEEGFNYSLKLPVCSHINEDYYE